MDAYAQSLGWAEGALVTAFTKGSPAEGSGLIIGDVIVAIDDRPIADAQAVARAIAEYQSNDKVTLSVYRHGAWLKVPVKLGAVPDTPE